MAQHTVKVGEDSYRLLQGTAKANKCSIAAAIDMVVTVLRTGNVEMRNATTVDKDTLSLAAIGRWYLDEGLGKQMSEFARAEVYKNLLGMPEKQQKATMRRLVGHS